MAIIELAAANFLSFGNVADSNIKWQKIEHLLTFNSLSKSDITVEQVQSKLLFRHVVKLSKIIHLGTGSVLNMSGATFPRAFVEFVESGLPIGHTATVYINHPAYSQLGLVQTVSFEISKYNLKNTLLLSHAVILNIIKVYPITHTLMLSHGAAVYKENKNYIGPHPDV